MTFQESKESLFYKILWGAFVPVFSIFLAYYFWQPGGLKENLLLVLPFLVFWLVYFYLVFGWVKDGQIKLCLNEKTVGVTGSLEDGEVKWSEINRIEAGWQLFLGFRCAFLVIEAKECEIVFCLSVLSPSDQEALKKAFAARGFSWDN